MQNFLPDRFNTAWVLPNVKGLKQYFDFKNPVSLTEHSSCNVCRQPERSFLTQQPDSLSLALFSCISLWISSSRRMHGENLAPRWISASCRQQGETLQYSAEFRPPSIKLANTRIKNRKYSLSSVPPRSFLVAQTSHFHKLLCSSTPEKSSLCYTVVHFSRKFNTNSQRNDSNAILLAALTESTVSCCEKPTGAIL